MVTEEKELYTKEEEKWLINAAANMCCIFADVASSKTLDFVDEYRKSEHYRHNGKKLANAIEKRRKD